jgi:site-specific recombinase XerD
MTTATYAPDALTSLRDSFELHLSAAHSPSTRRIYLNALDRLIRYLDASGMPTGARSVRREHVESFVAARRATVKPTTMSVEFRALQQFWKWCVDEEEIDRSPMERMKAPNVPQQPVPVVGLDDLRRLLKATEGKGYNERRDTAIVMILFDTGVRLGELVGLRVDDIELRERVAIVSGKTGTRAVRFGTKTAIALDRYLRLRRGHRRADSPALWLGQDGPMGASGVAQVLARRCREAGIPRINPHRFRHTFAHEYLVNGGQEGDLQRLAGWRSPLMLRRYGASMADERARRAYTSPVDRL